MPIECVWFDAPPAGPWLPGFTFPLGYRLSDAYLALPSPRRPAISVCVPIRDDVHFEAANPGERRGTMFCIDSFPTTDRRGAWVVDVAGPLVAGEKPDITVSPSINCGGIYHGWLVHGVLSDDG